MKLSHYLGAICAAVAIVCLPRMASSSPVVLEISSDNYRLRGHHLNTAGGIRLTSTATQPAVGSTSVTVGQVEALGISNSTQDLTASGAGFWSVIAGLSPLIDTDGDGTYDYLDGDDDNDGLSDYVEGVLGTSPILEDTDGDTLTDYFETAFGGAPDLYSETEDLNPLLRDTDGDGFDDDVELIYASNPLSQLITPANGDINEDGVVNVADVLLATQFALDIHMPTADQFMRADVAPKVDGIPAPDGEINAADMLLIQSYSLGLAAP